MSDIWKPYNMSRCDCETEQHSYFCIYYLTTRVVVNHGASPKIGTEKVRPVKATEKRGIR